LIRYSEPSSKKTKTETSIGFDCQSKPSLASHSSTIIISDLLKFIFSFQILRMYNPFKGTITLTHDEGCKTLKYATVGLDKSEHVDTSQKNIKKFTKQVSEAVSDYAWGVNFTAIPNLNNPSVTHNLNTNPYSVTLDDATAVANTRWGITTANPELVDESSAVTSATQLQIRSAMAAKWIHHSLTETAKAKLNLR